MAFASKLTFDESLFDAHVCWAKRHAQIYFKHHISNVPGTRTTLVELKQTALIGLWQAVQRFDEKKNITFRNYAVLRIKGAIVDEVRNSGFFGSIRHENPAPHILQIEENAPKFAHYNGRYKFEDDEAIESIFKMAHRKYRRVMRLYFMNGLTQAEVGKKVCRSESRVNQIIQSALNQIRRKMGATIK